jgi:hypothetical protein
MPMRIGIASENYADRGLSSLFSFLIDMPQQYVIKRLAYVHVIEYSN